MPKIFYLKEPPVSLVAEGEIDDVFASLMDNQLGGVIKIESIDKKKAMIVPADKNCNIAYISDITNAEVQKMKKAKKQRMEMEQKQRGQVPRIQQPMPIFPGGRKGRG